MREIKIPVNNVVGFTIGDIFVDVDIQFKPMSYVTGGVEQMAIDNFNSQMGGLAFELKQEIRKKVEDYFSKV